MLLTGLSNLRTILTSVRPVTFLTTKHISNTSSTMDKQDSTTSNIPHRREHLDLTAGQWRDPDTVEAQVESNDNISPTVKSLTLSVKKPGGLTFQSGQWVDFFIPGEDKVGGFSICSPPSQLESSGTLELAIKFSTWPPAHWVHTVCKPGDTVGVRVGGEFLYPTSGFGSPHSILLVAGGVGINPLYSIWLHTRNLVSENHPNKPQEVTLLYSARNNEELIFKRELSSGLGEKFHMKTFLTREGTSKRIQKEDLCEALQGMQGKKKICFICGPAAMAEQVAEWLLQLGVEKENVIFENWW